MSAIIKAVGVKFNDPALPILSPMITQGLVGAWRPNNSSMGLIDLSGNGNILTQQGNPELKEGSIVVNNTNGFATNIRETLDLTLFVVHRSIKSQSGSFRGFSVGSFYEGRGVSIWHETLDGKLNTNAQSFLKKISDGMMQNLSWIENSQNIPQSVGEIEVSVLSLKASDNKWQLYNPMKQSTPVNSYDASVDNWRFDLRNLSDPVTGVPNYYKLGVSNIPFEDGKTEIFEVLIYNRALTQEEIMRQYQYSKDFMQKHRGITI